MKRTSLRTLLVATCAVAVVSAAAVTTATGQIAPLDVSVCPDNRLCIWRYDDYNGDRKVIDGNEAGTGWHNLDVQRRSAKSRLVNKVALLRDTGGYKACVVPGSNWPNTATGRPWEAYKVKNPGEPCFPD